MDLDLDPRRTVADLAALHELTGHGDDGADRLCWTDGWTRARGWLTERLADLPVRVERDEAGNLWATLSGESDRAVAVGSHLDAVPRGGRLDGALGVLAGLEVLRAAAAAPTSPPRTLVLVDWADEEGARFGRSLFGSSAAAGRLDPDEVRDLTDADGRTLPDVLAEHGVTLERAGDSRRRLEPLDAYLELHIEQGPVLESRGVAVAAVTGCLGVERHRLHFHGRGGHAGTVPMALRRDPLVAAARTAVAVPGIAAGYGGLGTVGALDARPGIPTAVPGTCDLWLDLRHGDRATLAAMLAETLEAARDAARAGELELEDVRVWAIEPVPFDPGLVELAAAAAADFAGTTDPLPSGALHDAAAVAAAGVPTVMLFAQSLGGVSHAPDEATRDEDVELAVSALGRLAGRALAR